MGLGTGIALMVIGGVLAFGITNNAVPSVNLPVIGFILMAGGALTIILVLVSQQRGSTHTEVVERRDRPAPPQY